MKIKFCLFLIIAIAFGCNSQNSVSTNEIFYTSENLFGVKSKDGKLLIDSIYPSIRLFLGHEKLVLPPKEGLVANSLEYYLVSKTNNQKALFNKNGKLVFGFIDCMNIVIDQYTKTAVITKEGQANKCPERYLYKLNGDILLDTSYENIGFINNADLIVLIADDGPNDEIYLYNPFKKDKTGPFAHLNIYNEDRSPPPGMKEADFKKYQSLNMIKVSRKVGNDYKWGLIDLNGNEILPLEYSSLYVFSEENKNHPSFKKATKPEDVEFIFQGSHPSKPSTAIYFDRNLEKYEQKIISIKDGIYRIEKM